MYNLMIIFVAIFLCINNVECKKSPIVETTHGQISGLVFNTLLENIKYYGFMGIPFAEPPLGDLKFMDPDPVEPWDGILSATKLKPACLQFNQNVKKGQPYGMYGSEDCLYLDIFTPGTDEEKRAVIVFIYNEHFFNSYNKTKDYAPDFFIEEDVVVVTISHRLTAFGFLSLENEILPGNAGLKDIVLGLKWIKDNIEYFGGDPNRITLMGLQGGAAAIDLLIHSKAKGLFHAAILQSGTSWNTAYLQKNVRDRVFNLGEMMQIPTKEDSKLIRELRDASTLAIASRDIHASPKDYFKENQHSVISFSPIVEKQPDGLITEYPEDSDFKIDIPIMMGYNSREGLDVSIQYLIDIRYIMYLNKDFPILMPIRLKFAFDPTRDVFREITEEIKRFYLPEGKINVKSLPQIITYSGDIIINYAMDYTAKVYSKRSSKPVYYYHFDYDSELNENKNAIMNLTTREDGTWGTATGDEMCYLFKCPKLKKVYLKLQQDNAEGMKVRKKMIKLWTNFAKYGSVSSAVISVQNSYSFNYPYTNPLHSLHPCSYCPFRGCLYEIAPSDKTASDCTATFLNPTQDNDDVLEGRKWPAYTIEKKEYLHIDKNMDIKTDLNRKRFEFWDNFFEKWGKRAVDGKITESIDKKDEL